MSEQNIKLPCFETVISQMVKNIYKVEKCRYSDLETQLIEDFEIKSTFLQEDPDSKTFMSLWHMYEK